MKTRFGETPTSLAGPRAWALALALGAVGVAGPIAGGATTGLAWLALLAAPTGVVASGLGRAAVLPPLLWATALAPPGWEALVLAGLYLAGWGLGRPSARPEPVAAALLLLGTLLWLLPSLGGAWGDAPWPPEVAARLLDLSPTALVVESSGRDWMRHALVYGPVGADAMGPDVRLAFRGSLAGPVALVVGCVLARAGRRSALRRPATTDPRPCPPESSSAPSPRT